MALAHQTQAEHSERAMGKLIPVSAFECLHKLKKFKKSQLSFIQQVFVEHLKCDSAMYQKYKTKRKNA